MQSDWNERELSVWSTMCRLTDGFLWSSGDQKADAGQEQQLQERH